MWELATLELQYGLREISTTRLAGNFLLHSQTKPVLVKYTVGPIQVRGMGTRPLVSEAACLASISAFQFL
jgi:hypothetical protein